MTSTNKKSLDKKSDPKNKSESKKNLDKKAVQNNKIFSQKTQKKIYISDSPNNKEK